MLREMMRELASALTWAELLVIAGTVTLIALLA